MGKAQAATGKEKKGWDESEIDNGPPMPNLVVRVKTALNSRCAGHLDRGIGFLTRLRLHFVPATENDGEADQTPEPIVIVTKPPGRLRRFLVAVTMLLIGLIAGANFSYSLFAQRMESQGDKILDQADDLFQQQKRLDHADQALREVTNELKETKRQLETLESESKQIKMKFIEAEGRASLYGNGGSASREGNAGGATYAPARYQPHQAQRVEKTGNCNLLGNAPSAELNKCLEQFNR